MTSKTQKEIGLIIAGVLLSVINFFAWTIFFTEGNTHWQIITALVIVSVIWSLAIALGLIFIKRRDLSSVLSLLAAFSVVAAGRFQPGAIGGGLLLFLLLLSAHRAFRYELESRINFSSWTVFNRGLNLLVTGLILALAGLLLPTVQKYIKQDGIHVNRQYVDVVMRPLTPVFSEFIPGFSAQGTVNDFINSQIKQQQASLPNGLTLPESVKNQLRIELSRQFQQNLSGQETMSEVITNRINGFLTKVTQLNALVVALVIILLAFLTFRAVVPLIAALLVGLMSFSVWLGRISGIIRVETVTTEVERLEL